MVKQRNGWWKTVGELGANAGHLIMTDEWFNEYMFRLAVDKKYITDKVKEIMKQKPIHLPAWDPMFADED